MFLLTLKQHTHTSVCVKMNTNGLSMYNVATSLDLDALTVKDTKQQEEDNVSDDSGDEEEVQQRNAEVTHFIFIEYVYIL